MNDQDPIRKAKHRKPFGLRCFCFRCCGRVVVEFLRSALTRFIRAAYELLDLISFFTVGEAELSLRRPLAAAGRPSSCHSVTSAERIRRYR